MAQTLVYKADNTNALNSAGSFTTTPGGATNAVLSTNSVLVWDATVQSFFDYDVGGTLTVRGMQLLDPAVAVSVNFAPSQILTLGASGIDLSSSLVDLNFTSTGGGQINANAPQTWNVPATRVIQADSPVTAAAGSMVNLSGAGTVTLLAGRRFDVGGGGGVVLNGPTLNLTGGGGISNSVLRVTSGTLVQSNGTVNLTSSGDVLVIGNVTNTTASYSLAGGALNLSSTGSTLTVQVGNSSNTVGTFNLSGGTLATVSTNTTLKLGTALGSTGNFVQSGGTATVTFTEVGVAGGAGVFTLSGGTFNTDTLTVGRSGGASGLLQLNGGTLVLRLSLATNNTGSIVGNGGVLRNQGFTNITSGASLILSTNGLVVDSNTRNITLNGGLFGDGPLTKISTGTLTFSGSNAHNGALIVSNGVLVLNEATNRTYAGSLSGTGSGTFQKAGAGTLTLSGTSAFGGKVQVNGGNLVVSGVFSNNVNQGFSVGDFAGGHFTVTNGGTAVLAGIRDVAAGIQSTASINVRGGTLVVGPTASYSIGGLRGVGTSGNGTLTIDSGTNTVLGAATNVITLAVGSGGGTYAGTVNLNGGVLETARTLARGTNSGTLVASLLFNGGTLRLLADNTNWVSDTLDTNAFNAGGAVIDTAGFNGTIAKGATGSGGLVKLGAGALTLSASNAYTGGTQVSNGTLVVNGSIAASPLTTVAAGGTLGGTGSVGSVSVAAGGAYRWVNTGSPANRLAASALTLNGAWTVSVGGSPAPGTYTILTTASGITNFTAPTVSGASGSVAVSGNDLVLTVSGAGLTPFQQWQTNYFGTTTNASAAWNVDADNDGLSNLQENAFGSSPVNAGSVIRPQVGSTGTRLTITVPRNSNATDLTYAVQGGTNLLDWTTLQTLTATNPAPAGSTVTYTNATPFTAAPQQFLRVRVSLP